VCSCVLRIIVKNVLRDVMTPATIPVPYRPIYQSLWDRWLSFFEQTTYLRDRQPTVKSRSRLDFQTMEPVRIFVNLLTLVPLSCTICAHFEGGSLHDCPELREQEFGMLYPTETHRITISSIVSINIRMIMFSPYMSALLHVLVTHSFLTIS